MLFGKETNISRDVLDLDEADGRRGASAADGSRGYNQKMMRMHTKKHNLKKKTSLLSRLEPSHSFRQKHVHRGRQAHGSAKSFPVSPNSTLFFQFGVTLTSAVWWSRTPHCSPTSALPLSKARKILVNRHTYFPPRDTCRKEVFEDDGTPGTW